MPFGTIVLRQGVGTRTNPSPEVAELQRWLNNQGFTAGTADGIFGPDTKAAVIRFQQAWNRAHPDRPIDVDGVVGTNTRTAATSWQASPTVSGDEFGGGLDLPFLASQVVSGVPGAAVDWQYWHVSDTGEDFLVRLTTTEDGPPVPLLFRVTSSSELQSYFGGRAPSPHRTLTAEQLRLAGGVTVGAASTLTNTQADPIDSVAEQLARLQEVVPWFNDPEILSLWFGALLQGRSIEEFELMSTDWWQSHTAAQRQWLLLAASDPLTAAQLQRDTRNGVSDLLRLAGVADASDSVIDFIASRFTTGIWTEAYTSLQIRLLSDPFAAGDLDPELARIAAGLDTTRAQEDRVIQLVNTWIGPHMARWSKERIAEWAGRLRNDPDAEINLVDVLRNERKVLLPSYADDTWDNVSYADIVSPYRQLFSNVWARAADETDPFFLKVVNTNDHEEAARLLRSEGMDRGVEAVQLDALRGMLRSFGQGVREAV